MPYHKINRSNPPAQAATPVNGYRSGYSIDARERNYFEQNENWKVEQEAREKEDAYYNQIPESERKSIRMYLFLPFKSILEIDPWGDVSFTAPHIYCRFNSFEYGPFESGEQWFDIYESRIRRFYPKIKNRKQLFETLPTNPPIPSKPERLPVDE